MCRMCEGFSVEDVLALDAAAIAEYGFIVIGVEGASDSSTPIPWSYTVGLLDAASHPELIVAGPSVELAATLLNQVGRQVLDGERFTSRSWVSVEKGWARLGQVHPVQYGLGTFNFWHNLRAVGALHSQELTALQVFVPPGWFCHHHRQSQPDLSKPTTRLDRRAA